MTILITEPPSAIVSASEAKSLSPVLAPLTDDQVSSLISAAQAEIEPPNGTFGTAFGEQTIEFRLDAFPTCAREIGLPCPPVSSVSTVSYVDVNGDTQTLAESAYTLAGANTVFPRVVLKPDRSWPGTAHVPEAVTITFIAGYASDDPRLLPAKQAVALKCANLFYVGSKDPSLRSINVEGVLRRDYHQRTKDTADVLSDAADNLLSRYLVKR